MEKGIQYSRELSVVKTLYGINLDNNTSSQDADDMVCMWHMWQRVVWNAPSSYASTLAGKNWKDEEKPIMDEVASLLWQYEDNLSSSPRVCVSAAEKLVQEIKAKETASTAPPAVWTRTSSIRSKHSSAQARGYSRYTPCSIRWFYLHDHGEDMRKWDGKPTLTLQAWVLELQGKTVTRVGVCSNMESSVSSRQFSRQWRQCNLISKDDNETFGSDTQEMSNKYRNQNQRDPSSSQMQERDSQVYWTVWIWWPITSEPKKYEALVDTCAQRILMPSSYKGVKPICISEVRGNCKG